jgi:AcrR family transcriptional regulator
MTRRHRLKYRKQPRQERSRATVTAILDATARVLVREGYSAATTTRVACVAGVSIGSLYQYFPSRQALVAALVDRHIERVLLLLAEATQALERQALEAAVPALIGAILRMHAVEPELHAVLTRHFPDVEGAEKVRALNAAALDLVVGFLARHRQLLRPTNLRLAAFVAVQAVQAVVSAAVLERTIALDDPELAAELSTLVLRFLER